MAIEPPNLSLFQKAPREKPSSALGNLLSSQYNRPRSEQLQQIRDRFLSDDSKKRDLMQMILYSKSDIELFTKYYQSYGNYDDLVALGIFDEQKAELLNYFYQNDKQEDLITTPAANLDRAVITRQNARFQQFLSTHSEYRKINDVSEADNLKLPHIYLFGNKDDFAILEGMSLNTEIYLLNDKNTMKKFEEDDYDKTVLFSVHANPELASDYNRIFSEQSFQTLQLYKDKNNEETNVVPFTRKNLMKHLLAFNF